MIKEETFGTLRCESLENINADAQGTAGSGVAVSEKGDGIQNITTLTINTTIPAVTNAATAVGKLIYTFPSGEIVVKSAYMSLALDDADDNISADTPDVGVGTVIAASGVSLLSAGAATYENIITGQTAADCSGTATVKSATPTAGVPLVIAAADAHTVHMNFADTWAAATQATAMAVTGTVTIEWVKLA